MSETAKMLAETASRLLTAQARSMRADPATLLTSLREAGLDLALMPEESGGVGCSLAEAAEIARAWGAHAAPLPIVEILLAPRLASACGRPGLATDATIAQARKVSAGEHAATGPVLEAPVFPGCGTVLAVLPGADGATLVSLPCEGAPFNDLAGDAWVRIDPEAARDGERIPLPAHTVDDLAAEGALLTATLMSGAMDHVVATMVEHANTRTQFGRPIGKFQAVQHLIADASAEATVTRAAVQAALHDADRGTLSAIDWLAVKAGAGRSATLVASAAHQLLGAIGFTEEHELHHFSKRLWWWRDDWGRQADCEERLGALAASAGESGLWPTIVGE